VKELKPRITVLGVGGAGGNAVNNMIASKLEGVDFVVANTDAQSLAQSKAERRIQMGTKVTEGSRRGRKARCRPRRRGRIARGDPRAALGLAHGVHHRRHGRRHGHGCCTRHCARGARAGRAHRRRRHQAVRFEGDKRMRVAERGIEELQAYVDTLIIIPNQNLFRVANDRTTFAQAFAMADDVLHSAACAA
jgi:cell division protein FtsZ